MSQQMRSWPPGLSGVLTALSGCAPAPAVEARPCRRLPYSPRWSATGKRRGTFRGYASLVSKLLGEVHWREWDVNSSTAEVSHWRALWVLRDPCGARPKGRSKSIPIRGYARSPDVGGWRAQPTLSPNASTHAPQPLQVHCYPWGRTSISERTRALARTRTGVPLCGVRVSAPPRRWLMKREKVS
jgi:hypothetical protein